MALGGGTFTSAVVSTYNDYHYIATNNDNNWTNFSTYFEHNQDHLLKV